MNGSVSVLIIDGAGNSLWLHGVQAELILRARTVDEVQAQLKALQAPHVAQRVNVISGARPPLMAYTPLQLQEIPEIEARRAVDALKARLVDLERSAYPSVEMVWRDEPRLTSGFSRRWHGRRAPSSRREPILHQRLAPYGWPAPATSRHERRMPLVNSTRHVATRPPCPRRCPRSSRPGWAEAHRMGRAR